MGRDKGTKDGFCRSLGWGIDIRWFDLAGLHRLDGERSAKVELATRGTSGQYEGFLVTVLNKREGKVDSKFFAFDDYLGRSLKSRTDGREDYPLGDNVCFHVSSHCGWCWYIAEPKSARPFTEAVEAYLEAFR
jgi:hypothetical protein